MFYQRRPACSAHDNSANNKAVWQDGRAKCNSGSDYSNGVDWGSGAKRGAPGWQEKSMVVSGNAGTERGGLDDDNRIGMDKCGRTNVAAGWQGGRENHNNGWWR